MFVVMHLPLCLAGILLVMEFMVMAAVILVSTMADLSSSSTTLFITTLTLAFTIVATCAALVVLWQAGVLHKMITRIAPNQLQMHTGLNSNTLLLQLCLQRTRLLLQSDAHMTYSPILVHITPEGPHHTIYNSSRNPSSTQLFEPSPSNNDLIPTESYSVIDL